QRSQQNGGRKPENKSAAKQQRNLSGGGNQQSAHKPAYELKQPVFFIGFMGAGKTSVSRRLARMCHISSIDMDAYLERREDKKVKEIFADSGEDGFRLIETDVLKELAAKDPLLISCGGGVIKRRENREFLNSAGYVVYLKVSADEAAGRISDLSTRPLFQNLDVARKTSEERLPLYSEVADAVVDTSGKSVGRIAAEVRELLKKEGILCQLQE
ncbi:MAG: shikimate kinase, partial [Raoultibacter sp.]